MKITFIGAAHEVTGSCTLLENGGKYYLVDKGMEQGVDMFENVPLPVAPEEISAVFITHAHIDHTGMLPKLYKDGYRGPVYATSATCSLCNIMLLDSAHIQESEAEWRNRKATRSGDEVIEPLYTAEDVHGLMPLFRPCRYGDTIPVDDSIDIRFTDIGHLLGSACIEIWMREGETAKKIVFSGDVGNTDQPIIRDPQNVSDADYLVIESTYGDRLHESTEGIDVVSDFAAFLQRALDRGGNVVIPAFAVGRTQELLYALREIKARGLLHGHDDAPVFLDSPLAQEATAIFRDVDESYLDEEALEILHRGENPVWFDGLELSVTTEDSIAINNDPRPNLRQRHVRRGPHSAPLEAQPVGRKEPDPVRGLSDGGHSGPFPAPRGQASEALRGEHRRQRRDLLPPRHQRPRGSAGASQLGQRVRRLSQHRLREPWGRNSLHDLCAAPQRHLPRHRSDRPLLWHRIRSGRRKGILRR